MSHLPAHDDLITSAINYLVQAKNSLCRQYELTHSDVWAADRPLVEASRLVNAAIAILAAESHPAPPPGEAAALPSRAAAAACPAHPAKDIAVGGAGHTFDVGTAWIGPFHTTART
jgi:hypothetical protein